MMLILPTDINLRLFASYHFGFHMTQVVYKHRLYSINDYLVDDKSVVKTLFFLWLMVDD